MTNYQEYNGEFFPYYETGWYYNNYPNCRVLKYGTTPMQSLALLYPSYIADPEVFGCPSTNDDPNVQVLYKDSPYEAAVMATLSDPGMGAIRTPRDTGFGEPFLLDGENTGYIRYTAGDGAAMRPDLADGVAAASQYKSSYWYDSLLHFAQVGPGQAVAADASGMTWKRPDGSQVVPLVPLRDSFPNVARYGWNEPDRGWQEQDDSPTPYGVTWNETGSQSGQGNYWHNPAQPNHEDGQNVMYFDGHVRWAVSNYASDDPRDNIYTPNCGLDAGAAFDNYDLMLHGQNIYGGFTSVTFPSGVWGLDTDAWIWNRQDLAGVQEID
jgi:prepilin-type processing-associated H-X9-DG protein